MHPKDRSKPQSLPFQVARQCHKFSSHQPAGAVISVRQKFSHFVLLVIFHTVEQVFRLVFGKIAQHVRRFVGRHAFQDIRGMLIEFGVVHVEKVAATAEHAATVVQTPPESVLTFVRAIAALLTLWLCVIAARRFGDLGRAMILYTLGGIYLTLFNPRTEGLSYIILGLPAALWAVRELRDRRWWTAAFFIFFALSTQFSTQIALKHKNYWVRPLGAAVFAALIVVEVSRRSSRWDQRERSTAPSACG